MIKISQTDKVIVRQCKSPFNYIDENGEIKTVEIRVNYRSRTTKQIKEDQAAYAARQEADPKALIYLSETLSKRVESLPDLIGEDGQPVAITEEFLDTLAFENLQAIEDAINNDRSPKLK